MENERYHYGVDELIKRYPSLNVCRESIMQSYQILVDCFSSGNKLLIAGNGGSCADSEHIVGELMKGFKKRRPCSKNFAEKLKGIDSIKGLELANKLQKGLPCIALNGHPGLNTAFSNDVSNGGDLTFAQQIFGYGNKGDVFLAISTSGNSKNILYGTIVAKSLGMKIIGLTGQDGGDLKNLADVTIRVPSRETFIVQEYHLPVYHCLCLMLEDYFFDE